MDIPELLDRVDILDYISQYTSFEQRGREYWALSPLKQENTPSFSVDPEKRSFYDFSSGTGGDLLTFIQKYHHVNFRRATKMAQEFAGLSDVEIEPPQRLAATTVARRYKRSGRKERSQSTPRFLKTAWIDTNFASTSCVRGSTRASP